MIQIYGGCHSVHDISFSLIRHPILYQCLFRFLVVAFILQQIYVQDGYPLRPMLISMGIFFLHFFLGGFPLHTASLGVSCLYFRYLSEMFGE